MKKTKIFLALLALLPISRAFAQVGEIIYRDFEPDSILIYWEKLGPVWIDLDVDGEADDLKMKMNAGGQFCYPEFFTVGSVRICTIETNNADIVLSEVEEEHWKEFIGWSMGNTLARYTHWGFRIQREDGYCYGWFETYNRVVAKKNEKQIAHFGFDRTAYCTIPNYPLRWGQKSITGIDENESHHISKLYPNPATGTVRIEGEKSIEVQVYNTLGQLVKTVQNTNEVSLEGLPQGVYLLRVTLENGQVYSDKVVKE